MMEVGGTMSDWKGTKVKQIIFFPSIPGELQRLPSLNLLVPPRNLLIPSQNLLIPSQNLLVPFQNLLVPLILLSGNHS